MKTWSYLLAPFAAWLAAGCLKFAINSLRAGKPAFGLIGYGGMPSNHSAIVSSMAGIERMVLDMATQTPFARFFSAMAAPLPKEPGKAHTLSGQLKAYLDSEAVNSRTDDDKTLVMAVLHSPPSTPSRT